MSGRGRGCCVPPPVRCEHVFAYGPVVVDWKFEAHCACGHSWWILADVDDPDELATVECLACGETVFDVRPLAEHHRAGGDVE